MKSIYKSLFIAFSAVLAVGSLSSCEDYLDKEPGTDVNPEDAFKNFTNFQGFVEEIYNCIPHKTTCYWNTTFNWGEDEILSANNADFYVTPQMDNGDFKAYYTSWGGNLSFLYGACNHTSTSRFDHHTWNESWYCIRKANLGLENMDLMTDATDEERNFIKGQLLFFRGWWYEELFVWFGGMPYLERVPDASEELKDPRLTAQECAVKAAEDFKAAAELLPNDWDNTTIGKATLGQNALRITKATAIAYAGKCLLYASSPLYKDGASMGGGNTYDYDTDLAKQAADCLGESIALIESGVTPYELAEYYPADDYDALYNHDRTKTTNTCYTDIFYTIKQGFKQPGTVEAMMRGTAFDQANDARWGFATNWGSNVNGLFNGSMVQMPTANYVNYAYGMANGLPLDDPDSGFDPTHPFKNRDPRFYHDIVFDGETYINTTPAEKFEDQKYASLYTGGIMRDVTNASRTGYFCQKLIPHTGNNEDNVTGDWGTGFKSYLPYMRVADVYLMYAEAGAAASGATYKSSKCDHTAEDAINVIRDRVGVEHVNAKFTSSKEKFMDEVRRERACELAFEGFRFNDLQRWLLLTEAPYTKKTSQEFTRNLFEGGIPDEYETAWQKYWTEYWTKYVEKMKKSDEEWAAMSDAEIAELEAKEVSKRKLLWCENRWFSLNDAREAKVKGWTESTILTRNFGTKHYWFPIITSQVYLYSDFPQNPGW